MKKIFVCALAALAVAACSKEEATVPVADGMVVRLNAGMPQAESDSEVRAGYDGTKSVWIAGDEISIGLDIANTNLKFTQRAGSLSSDGTSVVYEGTLTSPVTGNVECVAYYPHSASATISGKTVTTAFPSTQTYTVNGFRGIPLFGTYSGDIGSLGMQFKNLYSVVKLTLTKDSSISDVVMLQSIVFKGNSNEIVSGVMAVNMSAATPVVTYAGSGTTITLDCSAGVELTSSPKTFYIAVPAINYATGYSLTFMTDKGQVTKKAKALGANYAINKIYAAPALAVKDLVTPFIIADVNLRNLLSGLGLIDIIDPLSGTVSVTALGLVTASIDLSGGNISVVAGLGNFPALATLNVSNNNLTALDVSHNPLLATLDCSDNQISSFDVSHNPLLATLDCSNNKLTALDVSSNLLLTTLKCYGNVLSTLNISNLESIITLEVASGANSITLTKLTIPAAATVKNFVSDHTKWVTFECKNNPNILTISLKANLLLTGATATGNTLLTSLNVTGSILLLPLAIQTSGNAAGFQVIR